MSAMSTEESVMGDEDDASESISLSNNSSLNQGGNWEALKAGQGDDISPCAENVFRDCLLKQPTANLMNLVTEKLKECPSALPDVLTALIEQGAFEEELQGAKDPNLSVSPPQSQWSFRSPRKSTSQSSSPMLGLRKSLSGVGLEKKAQELRQQQEHEEEKDVPDVDLDQHLREMMYSPRNSPKVKPFVEYLESIYALENFDFLQDVEAFKKNPRDRKARRIYEKYLAPDAPCPINLGSREAQGLHSRFGPINKNAFALASKAVWTNLRCDVMVRYLQQQKQQQKDEGLSVTKSPKKSDTITVTTNPLGPRRHSIAPPSSPPTLPSGGRRGSLGGMFRRKNRTSSRGEEDEGK